MGGDQNMKVSLSSMKILYWLVTLNVLLGFMLVSQLQPETFTWRLGTLQILFYFVGAGLFLYFYKVFGKAIIAASSSRGPRFNSRIKNQLWGLLNRTVSGVVGLGLVAVFLPVAKESIYFGAAVYAVIVIGGFFNDGKRFDEHHI